MTPTLSRWQEFNGRIGVPPQWHELWAEERKRRAELERRDAKEMMASLRGRWRERDV